MDQEIIEEYWREALHDLWRLGENSEFLAEVVSLTKCRENKNSYRSLTHTEIYDDSINWG